MSRVLTVPCPALLEQVLEKLKSRGETLALAESCTGGLLSAWIASRSGVSAIYKGGVVSYAGEVKRDLLGVKEEDLKLHGEVSKPVAEEMAAGAREKLGADWAVSITGIAGPSGGSVEKPVGTVCFGVAGNKTRKVICKNFDSSLNRGEIQYESAEYALKFLLENLTS